MEKNSEGTKKNEAAEDPNSDTAQKFKKTDSDEADMGSTG